MAEVTGRLRKGNGLYVGNGWEQTEDEAGPLVGLKEDGDWANGVRRGS